MDGGRMTLHELDGRLANWHRQKYGDRPVNRPRTFARPCEDLGELAEARNGHAPDAGTTTAEPIAEEAADMVLVLFHFVRGAGVSLADALAGKLGVIEARLTNPDAGRPPEAA